MASEPHPKRHKHSGLPNGQFAQVSDNFSQEAAPVVRDEVWNDGDFYVSDDIPDTGLPNGYHLTSDSGPRHNFCT